MTMTNSYAARFTHNLNYGDSDIIDMFGPVAEAWMPNHCTFEAAKDELSFIGSTVEPTDEQVHAQRVFMRIGLDLTTLMVKRAIMSQMHAHESQSDKTKVKLAHRKFRQLMRNLYQITYPQRLASKVFDIVRDSVFFHNNMKGTIDLINWEHQR